MLQGGAAVRDEDDRASSAEVVALLEQAAPLVQSGRFRAAVPLLQAAVAADPGSGTARKMLFWTRAAQLRLPLAVLCAAAGLWSCVDPGRLGLVALTIALVILIWFTALAVRARLRRRIVVYLCYAAAFLLGHLVLAPLIT